MRCFSFLLSLAFVPVFAADKPASTEPAPGRNIGRVSFVTGDVIVDGKKVTSDAPVREGTLVEVGNGKCTVLLGRDTVFQLARKSRIRVSQYGIEQAGEGASAMAPRNESAAVDIINGKLRALVRDTGKIKKDYKIRGAGVVMGVRGTQVIMDVNDKGANIYTVEGKVDVADANAVGGGKMMEVRAGQMANVTAGGSGGAAGGAAGSAGGAPVMSVATADAKSAEGMSSGMGLPMDADQGPPDESDMFSVDEGDFENFEAPEGPEFIDPVFNNGVEANVTITIGPDL